MKKIFCFSLFSVIWYVHGALPPPSLQGYMTPKEKTEKTWERVLSGELKISGLAYVDAGGMALCQVDLSQVLPERRSQFVPSFMEPVSTEEESRASVFSDLPACEGEELQDITVSAKHFLPPSGIRQAGFIIPPQYVVYALTAVLGCFGGQFASHIVRSDPTLNQGPLAVNYAIQYGGASALVGGGGATSYALGKMPLCATSTTPSGQVAGGGKALKIFTAGAIGCETVRQGLVYFFMTPKISTSGDEYIIPLVD